jgi:two-component system, chemotaxis family, chemotaxis protein CheY
MRVGLLEDDFAIQEMVQLVLQDEGYTVLNFPSATACLDTLNTTEPGNSPLPVDLIIVDWRLNDGVFGTDVIKKIRENNRLLSLPVILTTAATFSDTDKLKLLNVELLEKPFAVDDMLSLIQELTQS